MVLCSGKPPRLTTVHYLDLRCPISIFLVLACLGGCASSPRFEDNELLKPEPSIDLPTVYQCGCDAQPALNAFDLAIIAILEGRLSDAMAALEDYRASESPNAAKVTEIGLAFSKLLEENRLPDVRFDSAHGDERAAIMSLSLAILETLRSEVMNLEKITRLLEVDLAKREEALKRLRELTLGQPEE